MTAQKRRNRILLCIAIILGGIFLDQLTKLLAVKYLMPKDSVCLIPGVVNLTYVENPGAAFGMLKDHRWVFMVISTVAIVAMGVYLFTKRLEKNPLADIALSMIISGGIGNMLDRLYLGYVVDFIDISPLFSFAVFNGADSFVCVGAGLLVLATLLEFKNETKAQKEKTDEASL